MMKPKIYVCCLVSTYFTFLGILFFSFIFCFPCRKKIHRTVICYFICVFNYHWREVIYLLIEIFKYVYIITIELVSSLMALLKKFYTGYIIIDWLREWQRAYIVLFGSIISESCSGILHKIFFPFVYSVPCYPRQMYYVTYVNTVNTRK